MDPKVRIPGKGMIMLIGWCVLFFSTHAVALPSGNMAWVMLGQTSSQTLRGLGPLDWLVIGLYGLSMLGLGWFYSKKQTTVNEYFLAGRKSSPLLVGLSLFATMISTISYLSWPGEIIKHGPVVLWGVAALPLVYLIIGYWIIPTFVNLPITSAYQVLENRMGYGLRLFGSILFVLNRLVWMALMMYLAAKAIVVMLHWPDRVIPWVIIVSGMVTVLYTTGGGFRTVIITDSVQAIILMVGAVVTIGCISLRMETWTEWWPATWASNWDSQRWISFDPHARTTVAGSLAGVIVWWICIACSDQMAIQRYLATRDIKSARKAFLINSIASIVIAVLLSVVGLALLGFFGKHPEYLTADRNLIKDADYLFPHFIANLLPAGLSGLVVAGMIAAAMSSLSSGINSISTVITVDWLGRFRRKQDGPDDGGLKWAKGLSFGIGLLAVSMASFMGQVPGNVLEMTTRTGGLFIAPLGGMFLLTLFFPWATSRGVVIGTVAGFVAATAIAYWDVFTGQPAISFQWIIPGSLFVSLLCGSLISFVPVAVPQKAER